MALQGGGDRNQNLEPNLGGKPKKPSPSLSWDPKEPHLQSESKLGVNQAQEVQTGLTTVVQGTSNSELGPERFQTSSVPWRLADSKEKPVWRPVPLS